ncbi:MAG TPA: hypothetical protein VM386_03365, partial [Acidimicrobiales bacterium]|nr:hypothetical protein [Acidimicrobiales bacterium]
ILNEPFNEGFTRWQDGNGNPDYLSRISDAASLDRVLDDIFDDWSGLKVLTYQLGDLLEHALRRVDVHVIFLRRRNLLAAVVSNLIALQTNLWQSWEAKGPIDAYYERLEPLRVSDVEELLEWNKRRLAEVDAVISSRSSPTFRVVFEDVHLADQHAQRRWLAELWSFLGVEPVDHEQVAYHLDPSSVQMASPERYGRLPNATEINDALGSDDTGWLTFLPTRRQGFP